MKIEIIENYLSTSNNTSKLVTYYSNYIEELLKDKKENNDLISYDKEKSTLIVTCSTQPCSHQLEFIVDFSKKKSISYTCPFCNIGIFNSQYFMMPTRSLKCPSVNIMIEGLIIQLISSWLKDLGNKTDICKIIRRSNKIEIRAFDKKDSNFLVLEAYFDHFSHIVSIPTIMVTGKLRHTGTGMKMLKSIFETCKGFNYDLYIVNMVDSFFNRMLERGARQTGLDDVQITNETDLSYHY